MFTVSVQVYPPLYVPLKYFVLQMSWQLIKITATSSHPVRNFRGELIPPGEHTLWDQSDPSKYKDDGGSLQPNVYGYTFGSCNYS